MYGPPGARAMLSADADDSRFDETERRRRSWVDPFSPTPQTGYLVGMPPKRIPVTHQEKVFEEGFCNED